MDRLTTEQLTRCFSGEADVWLPSIQNIDWSVRDFLGWVHPAGHLGYMVLESPNDGSLRGIVLKRQRRVSEQFRLDMCAWCHHVHRMENTAMFSVSVKGSGDRHWLGRIACKDLDCSLRIRNLVKPDNLMTESLYVEARVWRMQKALHKWLAKAARI